MARYSDARAGRLSGAGPLTITSTVRDEAYQRELVKGNREATRNFSLHTTGWAFDVDRRYVSRRQALAFQNVLDRLSVLGGITWVREPDAIHVTVSSEAKALLPLLDRSQPSPWPTPSARPTCCSRGCPTSPGSRSTARSRASGSPTSTRA